MQAYQGVILYKIPSFLQLIANYSLFNLISPTPTQTG